MGAADLLRRLTEEGFTIVGDGDRLRVGPIDRLTDEHREQIIGRKVELLELVEHRHWVVTLPGRTTRFTVPQGMTRAEVMQHYATALDARPSG